MLAKALFRVCSRFDRVKVAAAYVRCGFVDREKSKELLGISNEAMTEALDWLRDEQQKTVSGRLLGSIAIDHCPLVSQHCHSSVAMLCFQSTSA
eukprot:11142247-Lingulodinium_polyedra.AAC.1